MAGELQRDGRASVFIPFLRARSARIGLARGCGACRRDDTSCVIIRYDTYKSLVAAHPGIKYVDLYGEDWKIFFTQMGINLANRTYPQVLKDAFPQYAAAIEAFESSC